VQIIVIEEIGALKEYRKREDVRQNEKNSEGMRGRTGCKRCQQQRYQTHTSD
jgi:hypothetical protein